MKRKLFVEWLSCTAASIAAFTVATGAPFLSPFVVFIAPFPLMVLTRKLGARAGALGALFGTAFVFGMAGAAYAFVYACGFGALGAAEGFLLSKFKSGSDYILCAVAASIASKLILMYAFVSTSGVNPFALSHDAAQSLISSFSSLLSQGGVSLSQDDVGSYADTLISTVSMMMPSMLILFSAADALLCYAAARLYFKKTPEVKLPQLPPFALWRFPQNIFWALLATLVLDVAAKAFPQEAVLKTLSLNLMEVLRALFLAEGLSLFWYFLRSFGVSRAVRVVLMLLCIFFSPVSYILSMLGIFDIWYDLRKRIKIRRR